MPQAIHRRVRLSLVALLAAVLAVASGMSSTVATASSSQERGLRQVTYTVKTAKNLDDVRAVNVKTGQQANALVDPPMSGCYLGNVGGTITGYWVNGQLSRTESTYFSSIDCTATAPGQSMEFLWDQASINLNSGGVDWGTLGTCTYPNMEWTPCLSVASTGNWTCNSGVLCAGRYWADHETFMTLPEGWIWTNIPDYCTSLTDRQISCLVESSPVTIPAFT